MKIKFGRRPKFNLLKLIINKNFFYKFYFFFTIICFVFTCLIFFQTGFWEKNRKEYQKRIYSNGIINYKYLPEIFYFKINSLFEKQKKIYIDLSQKNLIKIENNRKDILKYSKQSVPFQKTTAFILNEEKRLRSDIRLKGDRKIHFEDRKYSSYRIDIKKGEVFNEMKKFSIQKPRIRNYLHEWIFHELLGEGNLVKPKYDFYDFYLNGKYLGYYNIEESFGKVLLERNKRRNGPIFSIFEYLSYFSDENKYEVYNKKYWENPANIPIVKSAVQKINNFLAGDESLENVFDLRKWAWFFAVTDLTYTYHGTLIKSVKLYYNPVSGKFEPIGFDGHRKLPNFSEHIAETFPDFFENNFLRAKKKNSEKIKNPRGLWPSIEKDFFYQKNKLNTKFYELYVEAIKLVSSEKFLNDFFKLREKEIKKINSGIYSDSYIFDYSSERKGIGIYYFDKKEIYRRAEALIKDFSANNNALYIEEGPNNIIFDSYDEKNIFLTDGKIICKNLEIDLGDFKIKKKISLFKKNYKYNSTCNKISFNDNIAEKKFEFKINKYNSFDRTVKPVRSNYFEFFNEKNKKLFLKNKVTTINKNVFIPRGYEVVIRGGEEIILENNSFIFSNSNWKIGDQNSKTSIRGNRENPGGGIIIYDNENNNHIINCEFRYLNGLKENTLSKDNNLFKERIIMGAINFFQTNVFIEKSIFDNIFSEDAVNIISSEYKIFDTQFSDIKSDAIDIDFSNGLIVNNKFINIGNDAIDFSGSNSEISLINFKNVGDKGISVGENSFVKINDVVGDGSLVGIASKDGSKTFADNVTFLNIDYPFTAYQKKKAYEYGQLNLENYKISNFKKDFIKDSESIIQDNKSLKKLGKNNKKIDKIIEEII